MTDIQTGDTLLVKIAALLRQAESTDNEHEAEAYVNKAQTLASLAQIDLATARNFVPSHERREQPTIETLQLGPRGKMGLHTFVTLYDQIAKANDVIGTYPASSHNVTAYGMPSDIATVNALYASLMVQMIDASNAYIRRGEYKTETVWRAKVTTDRWGYRDEEWGYHPVSGRTARISFQEAFAYRVGQRLRAARAEAIATREAEQAAAHNPQHWVQEQARQALASDNAVEGWDKLVEDHGLEAATEAWQQASDEAEAPQQETSVALVLKAKSEEVRGFFNKKHHGRGHYRGGSSSNRSRSASAAGVSAANNARLSAPKGIGGSRGSLRA